MSYLCRAYIHDSRPIKEIGIFIVLNQLRASSGGKKDGEVCLEMLRFVLCLSRVRVKILYVFNTKEKNKDC